MKNKGFTLIELLAVIVILAIIALIAVPIILNIINDSKESANKRSIELYGKAVENAVADYMLQNNKAAPTWEDISKDDNIKKYYRGNTVECTTTNINKDGTVYLSECKVAGKDVEYTYGVDKSSTEEPTTPDEPTETPEETTIVYRWSTDTISIGDTITPSDTTKFTTDPTTLGKSYYLKHVIDKDNKVKESYACGVYNSEEYCVRGADPNFYGYAANESEYTGNVKILKGLKDEGLNCHFHGSDSNCDDGSVYLIALSHGFVNSCDVSGNCYVYDDGSSDCVSY